MLRSFSLSSPPFFFSSFPLQWFRLSPHLECCLHDLAIFVVKKQHKPGQAPLVLYSIKTRGVCKCVCVSVCVSVLVCVSLSTSLSLSRPLSLDLSTSSASPGSGEQVLLATKKTTSQHHLTLTIVSLFEGSVASCFSDDTMSSTLIFLWFCRLPAFLLCLRPSLLEPLV